MESETMAKEVGARLARAREAAGLRQAELARQLDVSSARLNNWETGDTMVPPHYVPKIFLLTRIDSNYLYQGDMSQLPSTLRAKLNPSARRA